MLEHTDGTMSWIELESSQTKISMENKIPQTTADLRPGKTMIAKLLNVYQIRPTLKALATIKICTTKKTHMICFIRICKRSSHQIRIKCNIIQVLAILITSMNNLKERQIHINFKINSRGVKILLQSINNNKKKCEANQEAEKENSQLAKLLCLRGLKMLGSEVMVKLVDAIIKMIVCQIITSAQ